MVLPVLHMHNSRNFNEQRLIRTVQVLVIQVPKPEKYTQGHAFEFLNLTIVLV